jgi:hypothetical protein
VPVGRAEFFMPKQILRIEFAADSRANSSGLEPRSRGLITSDLELQSLSKGAILESERVTF